MKKIVVLTGAGMSADSGLSTFRDAGGLWEGYDVNEVASVRGWEKDPEAVLEFYNQRRRQIGEVEPNAGHKAVARLEQQYDVTVVTQNVDDLHERAGSCDVLHLHGELTKARSVHDKEKVIDIGYRPLHWGDTDDQGHQLRPHIVWFGELVPMMEKAAGVVQQAEILIVIGTSLVVYPAAGLVDFAPSGIPRYLIDPSTPDLMSLDNWTYIPKRAAEGTPELVDKLLGNK